MGDYCHGRWRTSSPGASVGTRSGGDGDGIMCECHFSQGRSEAAHTNTLQMPGRRTWMPQQPLQPSGGRESRTGLAVYADSSTRWRAARQQQPGQQQQHQETARGRKALLDPTNGSRRSLGGGDDSINLPCVLYSEDRGIATITFNRPEVKHAVNEAIFARLAQLLREAADNPSVVAVILTGSGGYFTSGADVKEMASVDPGTVPSIVRPVGRFMTTLLNFPKIIVAAVNGPAVGVGVTLLPHCDIAYAYGGKCTADDAGGTSGGGGGAGRQARPSSSADGSAAAFWTPFLRLAIVPEFCSSVLFPEILGWSLANEMLVLGRKLSADEALSAGLVSTVLRADTEEEFLAKVEMDLRESVLSQHMGKESSEEFKRLMWSERRPRLMRVLKEELTELDRRVQAGHPQAALKHLARTAKLGPSKL